MSLTRQIAHNTIIQFIGKILGTVIGVLTIAILTRYLGKIGFGQYSTITAYLQIFGILIDLGLSLTIVRLISDIAYDKQKAVNNVFTFRFFSALIFLGLAPLVVIFFPYDNLIKVGVAITSLSFFFSSLNQILISLFQKELKMTWVAISEIIGRLILFILVFYFAYFDWGLWSIMWAVVLGSATNFLLNYFFALKFVKINFDFDWKLWKKIIQLTWPLALSIAFNLVYFKADTLILSLVRTQAEVGVYNAPYRVLEILTNFIYLFAGLIFPILTAAWVEKNMSRFKDIFQKTFDALLIITIPMIIGTLFVAKNLILLIAGPEFMESGTVLKILIFATGFIFINSLYGYTIVALDKQKQMVWAYVIVAVVSLTGYILTIPRYGYYGAAYFTVFSEALIFFFNLVVVTRNTKFLPSLKIVNKTILASLIMALGLYLTARINVLLQIVISCLIYIIALYLLKGFSREFVREIIKTKSQPEQTKIDGN